MTAAVFASLHNLMYRSAATGLACAAMLAAPAWAQPWLPVPAAPQVVPHTAPQAPSPPRNPYLIYLPPPQPAPWAMFAPVPAPAQPPIQPPAQPPRFGDTLDSLGRSLGTYFTPEEQALLMEYFKESIFAAFKGEEVFLPPDLAFKLEVLMRRMQRMGGMYLDNLVKQMEADLRRSLRAHFPHLVPEAPPTPGH